MVGSRPARLVGLSTGLVTLLTLQLINVIFVCFVNQFSNAQILAETSITNTVDLDNVDCSQFKYLITYQFVLFLVLHY